MARRQDDIAGIECGVFAIVPTPHRSTSRPQLHRDRRTHGLTLNHGVCTGWLPISMIEEKTISVSA